eukprot:TRINITY_DN794_c0_g1_i1.p1 TRINITY_DN794_c0_g1~~TRINITY_DN794_c0_g1_i1.p1  ORF type:complete len:265 (-),score=40.21 TRINITY_DN794_c0_g1_i1:269-1063(-)
MSQTEWVEKIQFYSTPELRTYVLCTNWDKNIRGQKVLRLKLEEAPINLIQQLWERDYYVRQVTFADNYWIILAESRIDREPKKMKQHIFMDPNVPQKEINDAQAAGHSILFLHYANKRWIMITEENVTNSQAFEYEYYQIYHDTDALWNGLPEEVWNKKLTVKHCVYGNGYWVVVYTKPISKTSHAPDVVQRIMIKSTWPMEQFTQCIKDGENIHVLQYSDKEEVWVIITQKENPLCNVHSFIHSSLFPDMKLKSMNLVDYVLK